eukprot:snap_masked-scaffold_3-processed-gene-21.70-mRNA-1 protein AED:1.00 eAED:1.00 QI:0/0/0/0/1/1/3/0/123
MGLFAFRGGLVFAPATSEPFLFRFRLLFLGVLTTFVHSKHRLDIFKGIYCGQPLPFVSGHGSGDGYRGYSVWSWRGGGSVGGVGFQLSRSWTSRYDISLGLLGCKLLLMFESLREILDNLAHI